MKFTTSFYSRKSHYWNEDRFITSSHFCMVIDGATPLIKKGDVNFARYLVDYIKKNINTIDGPISHRLEILVHQVAEKLNLNDDRAAYLPSASLSYVEFKDDYIHIGLLGDCEVTLKMKNGDIIRYYDDRLSKLDGGVIDTAIKLSHEQNISLSEIRPLIIDDLIANRNKANKDNGYFALVASKNYKFKELSFDVPLKDIDEIYLYSDGYSSIFSTFDVYSNHQEAFKDDIDVKEEINKIVIKAYKDRNIEKYPRFKVIDDISLLKIKLAN